MDGLQLDIQVDFDAVRAAAEAIGATRLPNTARAVEQASLLVQRLWLSAASGASVSYNGRSFSVKRVSGAYARSVGEGLEYPAEGDELHGRVTASAPHAKAIEEGVGPHDMKPGLLGGPRARRGKEGQRYTIVPFRHNTPGAGATGRPMPSEIYRQAKALKFTAVTGWRPEKNARGQNVNRAIYRQGGRLGPTTFGWRSRIGPPDHPYTHTTSIYSGMIRAGGKGQTSYLTFRVVSDRSPSDAWWSPGVEPRPIASAVAQMSQEQVTALIRAGFAADLALLGEVLGE